ncbi:MAG TPA: lipid-A-disaccharide synthase [Thermoanaerobaculia bacterium]|nr:lipid-A-disaccharide synthase [Thermoanaerobaculia bacterium]
MKLCVVAGEASGDIHAAEVIHELGQLDSDLRTFGIGGDRLAAAGMAILHHARDMGIVGLFNVLRHVPMFRRIFHELIERIKLEKPDAILLVDYPDFNLRVARAVRKLGIPVIYYISPQVWAWRKRRVRTIAKLVDHMLVIFPFEEPFYREHGVPVTYVGHPLVEQLEEAIREPRVPSADGVLRIALMPGSRSMEVEALLPPMIDAMRSLQREREVEAFVIRASTIPAERLRTLIEASGLPVRIIESDGREALADADVSVSSSGTATLEAAVLGVPVVVVYKLSPATYLLAKLLVKLPYFSLVNIVAGKHVVPELLQGAVNGTAIASAVNELVEPDRYRKVLTELALVRAALGGRGASRRAAAKIATLVRDHRRGQNPSERTRA